ncbi:MAG: beta-propeller domain-containing protein, partial [Thermocrispum sp.]
FLYWPEGDLVVVPMRDYGDVEKPVYEPAGALVLRVDGNRIERVGVVRHPEGNAGSQTSDVRRSLVIGDTLWTVSRSGAQANGLDGLERTGFVRFD